MIAAKLPKEIIYPESDGAPLGENTLQVKWIIALYNGFEALYRHEPDVFLAADLFWYPVEGDPRIVTAPDVMIAFGRPKGDRPSYKQWEEADIAPQIAIEVLSPGNKRVEMDQKFNFYERYGVEEYYVYDPFDDELEVWLRKGKKLRPVSDLREFISPRMSVRFEANRGGPMKLISKDGQKFRTYLELLQSHDEEIERHQMQLRKAQADIQQAHLETQRVQAEAQRAQALAAKLRELGVDPDSI